MKRRPLAALVIGSAIAAAGVASLAPAQQKATGPAAAEEGVEHAPISPDNIGGALVRGLLETPGCLGVDGGRFHSGKNVIIAWFENKAAAVRWYHSPTHRQAMTQFAGMAPEEHEPMSHVADEDMPVMVMASITYAEEPGAEGIELSISQIAIELYAPLPGGAYVNSRVAPDAFTVPHMKDWAAERSEERPGGY
jgi:hypothetical protein